MINQQYEGTEDLSHNQPTLPFLPKPLRSLQLPSNPFNTPKKSHNFNDKCRQKHLLKDQNFTFPYLLKSSLLDLTDFNPLIRARIRCWVTEELTKRMMARQTCAQVNYFIDMFLMKKGRVRLENLQELALACMIIGTKLNESERRKPEICEQTFSKEKIYDFQIQVMKRLEFKLNPQTHIHLANHILRSWSLFLKEKEENPQIYSYLTLYETKEKESLNSFRRLRILYEVLDIGMMVLSMLDYDLQDYVMNTFYFVTFKFIEKQLCFCPESYSSTIKQFTDYLLSDSQFRIGAILYDLVLLKKIERIYDAVMREYDDTSSTKELEKILSKTNMQDYSSRIQTYNTYYLKVAKILNQKN